MTKYFCDNCGKDITNEKNFYLTITYEKPSCILDRKVMMKVSRTFCEKCSAEKAKEILKNID